MSTPDLHISLLRPPVIQILRAAGFHSTRPAVVDTLTDMASRYLLLLASATAQHAINSHPVCPIPTLDDTIMALEDVGALRPQISRLEEDRCGEEDMRAVEAFLSWFSGPANREIKRVSGFIAGEGEVVDEDSLEKEDYLSALKKKHSKTGEESRFQGTVLGKDAEERLIVIEGGAESIKAWKAQTKAREHSSEPTSTISSLSSSISVPDLMEI
ncbi:bromodomain associated protein [Arthroderma uncinatum]|uniref:bromodomain associated protein n=1 Tax=Arthroderma uncinatum TaxID=74035 RepID=UPI00144A5BDD|nr:bromodomain associated protein [Arthroderma uncinatum]KAF3481836.1 bromodomain associated protein [Arthroderma uncinatum]